MATIEQLKPVQESATLPAVAQAKVPLAGGNKIAAIVPADIEQGFRLAKAIATAGFAPKGYLKNPRNESEGFDENKILVGMLHGLEVGFTPMAALQSIAVINGMPTIWGDGALALVKASGLLVDMAETIEGDGDKMRAVCRLVRKDQPSPIERTFSWQDAKSANLTGKQGPWQAYPKRMLQMRARSWALRDGFADVLKGLGVAEEVRDMGTLHENSDGTYEAPAKPTREQFRDQQPPKAEAIDAEVTETVPDDAQPEPTPTPPHAAPYSLFDPRSGEVEQHDGKGWIAAFKKLQAVCTEPFDLWEQTNVEAYQAVCAACLAAGNKKAKAELDAIGEQAVKLGIL